MPTQSRSLVSVPRPSRLTPLLIGVLASSLGACTSEPPPEPAKPAPALEPAPAPAPQPTATPDDEPPPVLEREPEQPPPLEPAPELDERKQALANVGRTAFDALRAGEFDALLALTPMVDGYLREVCAELPSAPRDELRARFAHCHRSIAWDAVAEAQVFAGKPTGAPASGCEAGIEDYGRLQLFLKMNDKKIWRVEFFGAVGRDGNAIGINGELSCSEVDEIPPLK